MSETRHFITVEWCNSGFRGIFAREDGQAAVKDDPWTQDEMDEFLGPFTLILSPKSMALTEQEVVQHIHWFPLAEYSHEWGFVLTKKDGRAWCQTVRELANDPYPLVDDAQGWPEPPETW